MKVVADRLRRGHSDFQTAVRRYDLLALWFLGIQSQDHAVGFSYTFSFMTQPCVQRIKVLARTRQ